MSSPRSAPTWVRPPRRAPRRRKRSTENIVVPKLLVETQAPSGPVTTTGLDLAQVNLASATAAAADNSYVAQASLQIQVDSDGSTAHAEQVATVSQSAGATSSATQARSINAADDTSLGSAGSYLQGEAAVADASSGNGSGVAQSVSQEQRGIDGLEADAANRTDVHQANTSGSSAAINDVVNSRPVRRRPRDHRGRVRAGERDQHVGRRAERRADPGGPAQRSGASRSSRRRRPGIRRTGRNGESAAATDRGGPAASGPSGGHPPGNGGAAAAARLPRRSGRPGSGTTVGGRPQPSGGSYTTKEVTASRTSSGPAEDGARRRRDAYAQSFEQRRKRGNLRRGRRRMPSSRGPTRPRATGRPSPSSSSRTPRPRRPTAGSTTVLILAVQSRAVALLGTETSSRTCRCVRGTQARAAPPTVSDDAAGGTPAEQGVACGCGAVAGAAGGGAGAGATSALSITFSSSPPDGGAIQDPPTSWSLQEPSSSSLDLAWVGPPPRASTPPALGMPAVRGQAPAVQVFEKKEHVLQPNVRLLGATLAAVAAALALSSGASRRRDRQCGRRGQQLRGNSSAVLDPACLLKQKAKNKATVSQTGTAQSGTATVNGGSATGGTVTSTGGSANSGTAQGAAPWYVGTKSTANGGAATNTAPTTGGSSTSSSSGGSQTANTTGNGGTNSAGDGGTSTGGNGAAGTGSGGSASGGNANGGTSNGGSATGSSGNANGGTGGGNAGGQPGERRGQLRIGHERRRRRSFQLER